MTCGSPQVKVTPIPTPKEGAAGAEHAGDAVGETQFESGRWKLEEPSRKENTSPL